MSKKTGTGNFFEILEICNKLCGFWPEDESASRTKRAAHISWTIILLSIGMTFFVLEAMMIRSTLAEPVLFFKTFGMFVAQLLALMKFILVRANYKKLQDVKGRLQSKEFQYGANDSFSAEEMVLASKRFCSHFIVMTYIVYFMVGVSAHISALWSLNKTHKGMFFEGNATCYDFIPYFFFIPFDSKSTRICKDALIFMDVGLGVIGCYVASYDSLFCTLLISMKTNLEILSEATRSIRNRTLTKMGLPKNFQIFRDEDFSEYEQELYNELKKCNFHLATLIDINKDIEAISSPMTLLQIFTSVFMMASNMYISSLLSFSDPGMYSLIATSLPALVQLYIVCYFGNSITVASLSYRQSLYECDWYTGSKRFKTCILIMMLRLEKPLHLTAGKFFPLTLETVISVTLPVILSISALARYFGKHNP